MGFQLTETSAFQQFKPLADAIQSKMIERQTNIYDRYVAEYGNTYPTYSEISQRGTMRNLRAEAFSPCRTYATVKDANGAQYAGKKMCLDLDRLNKHAKELGESSVLGFVAKLIGKLGNITLRDLDFSGGADFTIRADINGHTVRVDQKTIYKVSSGNTLFCQFPARIYVDGKFTPAAEFQTSIKAAA
jgi:hypothetical protein